MFKKYQEMCHKLNINYKKDLFSNLAIVFIILAAGVALLVLDYLLISILVFIIALLFYQMHLNSLRAKLKQLIYSKEIAFGGFYRYVISLIKNGHILYSALQSSLDYVNEVLVNDINTLISEIELDTSLQPFLNFMDNFEDDTIKQMIILLYKTQDSGVIDDVIESVNECMVNLQDNAINYYIDKEEKNIEKYNAIPIVLSALIMIIVTTFIFTLIGSGSYV